MNHHRKNSEDADQPPNRDSPNSMRVDADEVHELYERVPYPADNKLAKHTGAPLPPVEWINAVARPEKPVVGPGARVLVAGCGTGAEAFRYASAHPKSSVVGVDFSERSIAVGRELVKEEGFHNVTLDVADLTQDALADRYEPFDFISLHGVIDYIPNATGALATLTSALKPDGCLYLGANGPSHPNVRYKRGMKSFGLQIGQLVYKDEDREKLRAIEIMMGPDCDDSVVDESDAYLASDVFASQNHSNSMEQWVALADAAGLHLLTSFDLPALIPPTEPRILRHFLRHSRADLSQIAGRVQLKSFMRMLFVKEPRREPPWTNIDELTDLRPAMLESSREQLPRLTGDWQTLRLTTISLPGIGRQRTYLSPAVCEFLSRCDGQSTALEIWASLAEPADWETLVLPLFSCFQSGVLHWHLPFRSRH